MDGVTFNSGDSKRPYLGTFKLMDLSMDIAATCRAITPADSMMAPARKHVVWRSSSVKPNAITPGPNDTSGMPIVLAIEARNVKR
jgi:hypothetical protein